MKNKAKKAAILSILKFLPFNVFIISMNFFFGFYCLLNKGSNFCIFNILVGFFIIFNTLYWIKRIFNHLNINLDTSIYHKSNQFIVIFNFFIAYLFAYFNNYAILLILILTWLFITEVVSNILKYKMMKLFILSKENK